MTYVIVCWIISETHLGALVAEEKTWQHQLGSLGLGCQQVHLWQALKDFGDLPEYLSIKDMHLPSYHSLGLLLSIFLHKCLDHWPPLEIPIN